MTLKDVIDEALLTEKITKHESKKRENRKTKKKKNKEKNEREFQAREGHLPGRERLIKAVCNMTGKSYTTVKPYVEKRFKQWWNRNPEAKWILDLEEHAKKLGFDPREYRTSYTKVQERGASSGKGGVGDPEYDGRAYFFDGLRNGFAKHFEK